MVFRAPAEMHFIYMVHMDLSFFSLCFSCGFSFLFHTIVESNCVVCLFCVLAGSQICQFRRYASGFSGTC